jgi:hypothetical protein
MLPLGGLHVMHAAQRGIWVLTQHLLWDRGKPRKTLVELAGRWTFRDADWLLASSPALNARNLTLVPICAVALFEKYVYIFVYRDLSFFVHTLDEHQRAVHDISEDNIPTRTCMHINIHKYIFVNIWLVVIWISIIYCDGVGGIGYNMKFVAHPVSEYWESSKSKSKLHCDWRSVNQ